MKVAIIEPRQGMQCLGLGENTQVQQDTFVVAPVDDSEESETCHVTFCEQFQKECDCSIETYLKCLSKPDSNLDELSLHFEWSNDTGKLLFRLEGSVLQGLKNAFGDNIKVQLEIKHAVVWDEEEDDITDTSTDIVFSKKMPISLSTEQGCFCEDDNMEIPKPWKLFLPGLNTLSTIALNADIVICICFEQLFPQPPDRGNVVKKILDEEIETDFTIVAMEEAEIKCHKSFLSAQSPVFAAMFRNDCQEKFLNRIEMVEMSEEGVKALLAYLYYGGLAQANETSIIAFELLEAGHKYEIQPLEENIKLIMLQKPNDWLDVFAALKIFSIYGKQKGFENLKTKAVQVMKEKRSELEESEDYQKLFEAEPKTAMELFKAFST